MSDAEKCWSNDEEMFSGNFEDVCRVAFDSADPEVTALTIYEADSHRPVAGKFMPSADEIIERAVDNAADAYGGFAEEWMQDVTQEQMAGLDATLRAAFTNWAISTGHSPQFFCVENVRELKVCRTGEGDFEIVKD